MTQQQAIEIQSAGVLRQFEYEENGGRRYTFYGFVIGANATHVAVQSQEYGTQNYFAKSLEVID